MTTPMVSVLMTAYNREQYVAQAIQSVLDSTFTDFELIIVDDCSSDRTVDVARSFEEQDDRVTVHVNEKNLGDYPNRNRAARLASGKYIKYVDSDDVMYPFCLGYMVDVMESNPDVLFGVCQQASPVTPYPLVLGPTEAYQAHFFGAGVLSCGPTGSIVRRAEFEDQGLWCEERFSGDTLTWLKLSSQSSMVVLPGDLLWWRQHDAGEYQTGLNSAAYITLDYEAAMQSLTASCCPLAEVDRNRALKQTRLKHARNLSRLALRLRRPAEAVKVKRDTSFAMSEIIRGLFSTAK